MLAAVTLFTGTYSLIDRLANALSHEVVGKVLHEASRTLDTIIRRQEQGIGLYELEENGQPFLKINVETNTGVESYRVFGRLPSDKLVLDFLEDTAKDISLARSIAALAMSIVAKAHASRLKSKTGGGE